MSEAGRSAESTSGPLPKPAGRRWLSIVLGLVIFASGFVAGAATMGIAVRNRVLEFLHHPQTAPPALATLIDRKFGLNDSQAARVEEILEARMAALIAIRRRSEPDVMHEMDLLEQGVSDVLNPDQRRRWQEWFSEMRSIWVPPLPPMERNGSHDKPELAGDSDAGD